MLKALKFSHKIFLTATLVVIVTFSLFIIYIVNLQLTNTKDNIQRHLDDVGYVMANNIESWLTGRTKVIENMTQSLELDPSTGNIENTLMQAAQQESFYQTSLAWADGSLQTSPGTEMPKGYDSRTESWYKDTVASANIHLGEPYIDQAISILSLSINSPVKYGGKIVGVTGGNLSLKALSDLLGAVNLGGQGYVFLVNANGKVLLSPIQDQMMKSLSEIFPGNTPEINKTFSEINLAGANRILTFRPIEGLPSVNWYIGISIDKDQAYAALDKLRVSAVTAMIVAVLAFVVLLGLLTHWLMQPLREMGQAMQDIAQGESDLKRRLTLHSQDEFGELAASFNRFVERIHGSIREVSSVSNEVNEMTQLVLTASSSSMSNSQEQANRTNSVVAAINQLGAASQEIASNAADASRQASEARRQVEGSRQAVEMTIQAMNGLSEKIHFSCATIETLNSKAVNIGHILDVIKAISEQTNLLALNAAIEAARAGEVGRGFAVVADEVRNLAHRTQESTQEIHSMIEQLQAGAREAVITMTESQRHSEKTMKIAGQAGEHLGKVTMRISEIDGMNQSVAIATEEQTAVLETLDSDITQIDALNQSAVQNLRITMNANDELNQQTARLKKLVDSFSV
nr:methyl-accepting chemotaxis protein [Pseudomonas sp. R37(2017)]